MSYELGYATAMAEARGWPAPRLLSCLRRRREQLETLSRYEPGRRDWLDADAGKVDALADLLAAAGTGCAMSSAVIGSNRGARDERGRGFGGVASGRHGICGADLSFESMLTATRPLAQRPATRVFPVILGEQPGYRWTINGHVHGEDVPFEVRHGERVEMTFMNPTMMSHPMHIHGHHFQVVGLGVQRFSGPVRDTVIVPPHMPVTIAFDAGQPGEWFLHCHHLYHMAGGMMTSVRIV